MRKSEFTRKSDLYTRCMKRTVAFILCAFCVLGLAGWQNAYAQEVKEAEEAGSITLQIDQIRSEDRACVLYVNQDQGESWLPLAENSALAVDGVNCAITQLQTFEASGEGISYVFLVDVSGSMNQARIDAIKEMLNQFVDGMRAGDSFCITTMGNSLTSSGFLQSQEEIRAFVDQIAVTSEDTNLYQSIKEEISLLQAESTNTKKCLIIFSDGAEDQSTGITRDEATEAVKESYIPVYTVAMLKDQPTDAQIEAAKVLGSFARSSAGGEHFAPVIDGTDNTEIYGKIREDLNSSLVVTATAEGSIAEKDTLTVSLTLSDGRLSAHTERKCDGALLAGLTGENDVSEDTEAVTDTETLAEEPENPLNMRMIIMATALVIVVISALAVILIRKRGKEALGDDHAYVKKVDVAITQENGAGQVYNFTIRDELKIGRSRRCRMSIQADNALSEEHCSILLKQGELYVKDENSTNGTYVNGVPVVGEYKLEQGDVLLFGSGEYRITWM